MCVLQSLASMHSSPFKEKQYKTQHKQPTKQSTKTFATDSRFCEAEGRSPFAGHGATRCDGHGIEAALPVKCHHPSRCFVHSFAPLREKTHKTSSQREESWKIMEFEARYFNIYIYHNTNHTKRMMYSVTSRRFF